MKTILILHGDTPAGQAAIEAAENRSLKILAVSRAPMTRRQFKKVQWFHIDTSDHDHVEQLASQLDREKTAVDILLTCPFSVFVSDGSAPDFFDEKAIDSWDRIIRHNLRSVMLFCKVFGKRMSTRCQGRIIQLVSNVSIDPHDPRHFQKGDCPSAAYAAAMGAIQALSRHLAAQYQDNGVLINNIIYGPLSESEPRDFVESYAHRVPMGRVMTIKDLANTIDLLLDPHSSYITGQNIMADGGVAIW